MELNKMEKRLIFQTEGYFRLLSDSLRTHRPARPAQYNSLYHL